jgi:hypothetical protein
MSHRDDRDDRDEPDDDPDYRIVTSTDVNALEQAVRRLCRKGWRVQGGVSVAPPTMFGSNLPLFVQALTRD